jgi:hypothetical protein
MKTTILILVAFFSLCFVPVAQAQVTQSAQIAVNTLNTTANIVTLDTAATALQETVTTPGPGALVCSTYPVVTFIVTRNAVNSTLAVVTMASGVYWQAFPLFTPLLPGDLIFAKLTTAGIGCTNELPLTVSTIYSPQAGLCDSNPSACVNLTGTIAATNGLTAKNLTLTFRPSQAAFLGGVPPNNPSSGGGSSAGICELLGVNPGDICYFSGSAWGILTGNNTGTKNLTENASGVPAWGVDPANYQHNDTSVAAQPALDFEDGGGVTFSLTNDSANNRVKVSAAVPTGVTSIQPQNNGTPYGSAQTGAITMNFANCTVSATFTITCPSGTGTVNSGTASHLGYYATTAAAISDMGADFTWNGTHSLIEGASGILDLHSGATSGFLLSGSYSTGFLAVTTTTGAVGSVATSGTKCYPYGGSGGTGCDTPGGGLTNVTGPPNILSWVNSGGTATASPANETSGYVMAAPPIGTTLSPYRAQPAAFCSVENSLNAYTCSFPQGVGAKDSLYVAFVRKDYTGENTATITDNHGEIFTNNHVDVYPAWGDAYFDNTEGGATTITVTISGTLASSRVLILIWDIAQTSGFDASPVISGYCGGAAPPPVTTVTANDLIIGSCLNSRDPVVGITFFPGAGWLFGGPSFSQTSPYDIYGGTIYATSGPPGVYQPIFTVSTDPSDFQSFTIAFKPLTPSGSGGPWAAQPFDFSYLWNTFPALNNYRPPLPSLYPGDTGIGLHQGASINAEAVTSAYSAQVLFAIPVGNDLALDVDISVDCHTATGTLVPSFTYTTAGGDATTITGSTTVCGAAPTSIRQSIRAKAGTNITFTTASLTNSPSYNVSARVTLQGAQ